MNEDRLLFADDDKLVLDLTAADFFATLRAHNISGVMIARLLGRDPDAVSHWRTGKVALPRYAIAFLRAFERLPERDKQAFRRAAKSQSALKDS